MTKRHNRDLLSAALRSGKFTPSKTHALKFEDGHPVTFNVVALAHEVFRQATNCGQFKQYSDPTTTGVTHSASFWLRERDGTVRESGNVFLLTAVQDWYGFSTWNMGFINVNTGRRDALTYNNDNGWTFAQVAEILDAEPAGLCMPESKPKPNYAEAWEGGKV